MLNSPKAMLILARIKIAINLKFFFKNYIHIASSHQTLTLQYLFLLCIMKYNSTILDDETNLPI
jgi:hypothetical protein